MTDVPQARKKVVLISRYSSPRSGPAYDGVSTVIDREIFTAEKKMADIDLLRFDLSVADFSDPTEIWFPISNVAIPFLVALMLFPAHLHKVRVDFNDETCTYLLNKGNTNLKLDKAVIFFIIHKPLIHSIQRHSASC